ncbi:hypothetical protein Sa4125_20950 [Aureimonas sp. SA4125]|uniref:hypothetical protein n=1 Tax=Aureimonas sp. SA4125 TaxID=2826993 RepID=UPI001CC491EB|nr:hypothetical protein [Aureimonas sp. SA4125]BDA84553.1 hypothetical protein Sa4125_20950 [Aureimonas sp. SA4125]
MPSAHHQIADAARVAWDCAHALLIAARTAGADRVDIDALADYADEQRCRWHQALADDTAAILAALDYGATGQESVR